MLTWLIIIIVIVFADQLSKWLAVILLEGKGAFDLIRGVLRFVYVENDGAAFGMLDDKPWIFLILSSVAIAGILFYLWRYPPKSRIVGIALALVSGGGIGNMIDRTLNGYVVDFIDFCAFPKIWVWVFNIADSCICVGVGMLILYLITDTVREYKKERASRVKAAATVPDKEAADADASDTGSTDIPDTDGGTPGAERTDDDTPVKPDGDK